MKNLNITLTVLFIGSLFFICSEKKAESDSKTPTVNIEFISMGKTNDEIISKINEANKPGFLYFTTDWCVWCERIREDTYSKPEIKNYIENNFVPFWIDAEKNTGPDLKKRYGVAAYPTVVIVNKNGEVIDKVIGYDKPEGYLAKLKNVLSGEGTLIELMKKYENNKDNYDIALELAIKMINNYNYQGAEPILKDLEKSAKDNRILAGTYYYLGKIFERKSNREKDETKKSEYIDKVINYWQWILDNYNEFEKIGDVYYNLGRIHFYNNNPKKGITLIQTALNENLIKEDKDRIYYTLIDMFISEKEYSSAIKYIKLIPQDSNYYKYVQPKLGVCYYKQGNEEEGKKHLEELFQKAKDEPKEINRIASLCASEKVYLNEALEWMKKAVEKDNEETYYILYNYARLLFETGNVEKAIEVQEKAIEKTTRESTRKLYEQKLKEYEKAMGN